ncbi:MaoC family dehydratase N-terminal domain-containing protein [Dactylosporangium sp. NPDC005572]|uniref:FAS1-like dehydratase domain-containing protein n=1 Tax=Dactylosporangium sp. NPDC005572 TaxID=3156889 RepID=UPI0033BBAA33
MSNQSNISPAMRDAVGGELSRSVSYPVSAADIRRWAIAVYYPQEPPALFWDAEYAATTRFGGIVAPEDFNPFAWMSAQPRGIARQAEQAAPDRIEDALGIPGPGLAHQLNGGLSTEYGVRIRCGDVITSVSRLGGYDEHEGRLGLMLFTVTETTWTNQDDAIVKLNRMTLIRY